MVGPMRRVPHPPSYSAVNYQPSLHHTTLHTVTLLLMHTHLWGQEYHIILLVALQWLVLPHNTQGSVDQHSHNLH